MTGVGVEAAAETGRDQEFGPEVFGYDALLTALVGGNNVDPYRQPPILPMSPQQLFEHLQRFRNWETSVHLAGHGDERAYFEGAYERIDEAVNRQDPQALIEAADYLVSSIAFK